MSKKRKANGKTSSKAPRRAPLESFDIGLIPVPPGAKRGKLTPEEATRWLREDHDAYAWLCALASRGKDKATKDAGESLTAVAKSLGCSRATLHRRLRNVPGDGSLSP